MPPQRPFLQPCRTKGVCRLNDLDSLKISAANCLSLKGNSSNISLAVLVPLVAEPVGQPMTDSPITSTPDLHDDSDKSHPQVRDIVDAPVARDWLTDISIKLLMMVWSSSMFSTNQRCIAEVYADCRIYNPRYDSEDSLYKPSPRSLMGNSAIVESELLQILGIREGNQPSPLDYIWFRRMLGTLFFYELTDTKAYRAKSVTLLLIKIKSRWPAASASLAGHMVVFGTQNVGRRS